MTLPRIGFGKVSARAMRRIAGTCMALFLGLITVEAMAAPGPGLELQLGRSYTDGRGAGTAFVEAIFVEHPIGSTRFTWAPDFSVGWIDGRNVQRYRHERYTLKDSVWLAAAGARFRYGAENDWYHHLFFSFQPVLHSDRTHALSSAYEFASTLGWQGERFSVQVRHISNGSTHEPNSGETMPLFGVRLH